MATVKISRSGSNFVANPLGYVDRPVFDSYRRCVGAMRFDAARRVQWTPDAKIAAQAAAKLVEAGFSILYEPASLAEDLASVSGDMAPAVVAPPTIGVTVAGSRIRFAPTTRLDSEWSTYMTAVQSFTVYDRDAKCNVAMSKDAAVRAVSALQDAGFRIEAGEGVEALLKSAIATRAIETHEGEARLAAVEARLTARGAALYPFQRAGVRWLLGRQNALLADEMGLGKTVQTIVALPESAPTLIVCPAVAKGVWRRELAKWIGRPVTVLKGRGSLRWPAKGEVLVTNYDVLQGANELGAPPAGLCIVADEAHAVKNKKALRSTAFRALCDAARSVEGRVWMLTATPLLNNPAELWTILDHAGLAKEAFGSRGKYQDMFNARVENVARGVSALVWGRPNAEVGKHLERVMLRRLRADVLPDLPGKTYKTIPVEIPKATAKKFDAILAEMERVGGVDAAISGLAQAEKDGKGEAIKNVLTRGSIGFEQMSEARALLALAKTQALLDLVDEIEEEGEPVVVFSAHRHPIDELGKRPGWAVITGDTKPEERTVIEDRFQNGKLKGVACTIKAGGVAITLTKAHQAIFVDQEWTPALNQQAEDRVCRIGQTRGVVISLLVCEHPLDERVAELLTGKANLINGSVERGRVTSADGIPASLPAAPVRFDELAAEAKLALEEEIRRIDPKLAHTPGATPEGVRRPAESAVERWAAAGLQVVASMDQDRAMEQNGVGFSKFDNDFGHKLAAIASTGLATPRQWLAICKLAHRYRGQIGADVSRYEEEAPRQVEEGEPEPEPAPAKVEPAPAPVGIPAAAAAGITAAAKLAAARIAEIQAKKTEPASTVPFSATITSKSAGSGMASPSPVTRPSRVYDVSVLRDDGTMEKHQSSAERLPDLIVYGTTLIVSDPQSRAFPIRVSSRQDGRRDAEGNRLRLTPVNSDTPTEVRLSQIVAAVAEHFGLRKATLSTRVVPVSSEVGTARHSSRKRGKKTSWPKRRSSNPSRRKLVSRSRSTPSRRTRRATTATWRPRTSLSSRRASARRGCSSRWSSS